jgi:hypothetical protein
MSLFEFRPKSYWIGAAAIDYPLRGEAPGFGGGSYLPRATASEVEIAGVALASTTGDVISVRARPIPNGIRLRVVDEYGARFKVKNPVRVVPLSLGELVELIDTTEHEGMVGLVEAYLDFNWEDGMGSEGDPAELQDFAQVVSDFYPQLGAYYEQRAEEWVQRRRAELRAGADAGPAEPGA